VGSAVLWSTLEWAEAVAALPAGGPLPARTVLVPRARVAHALRRELLGLSRPDVLCGTRFLLPAEAAAEVLHAAGVTFTSGEEGLRGARLLAMLRGGFHTAAFPADLVGDRPGWDEALARTILELEEAGLRPDDLERSSAERVADVARFWRHLDESAGRSFTTGRVLVEATAALESGSPWPLHGATLFAAAPDVSAAEARFARAIPDVRIALLGARPVRETHLRRMAALLGEDARSALLRAEAPRAAGSERDVLCAYLFEPPALLADAQRPRSAGADGTVELEEFSGVDAELEAAARWVGEQVLKGTPLDQIAVLFPALDPMAELLVARLARLPGGEDGAALPVHVAGGLPLSSTGSGARTLAVLRALSAHLAADALRSVLPALRLQGVEGHLSLGAATELCATLGADGGDPANPSGALCWTDEARTREQDLIRALSGSDEAEDDEHPGRARQRRTLRDLRAVLPALDALSGVARRLVERAPLAVLWPELRAFLDRFLLHPGDGPGAHDLLDERIAPLCEDPECAKLSGTDALALVEGAATSTRWRVGRFGDPCIYLGTVRDAAGLRFAAVRILGLCEGHLPSAAREDPVLMDVARAALHGAPATAADRVLHDLFAIDRVVRDAGRAVVLSAPRTDAEASQREASSVLLEAAAALGRDAGTVVPDLDALRRDYFAPARQRQATRGLRPLSAAAWQDAVARGLCGAPPSWSADALLVPGPLAAPDAAPAAGPLWGMLGGTDLPVPGLAQEWPLSSSGLKTLLECPYRFMLERMLGLSEPASLRSRREIDAPAFGTLLHRVAESFYDRHGADLAAGKGDLRGWLDLTQSIADLAFDVFLRGYPLTGDAVRRQERDRLRRAVRRLVEFDWGRRGTWRLVGVERAFGFDRPVPLRAGRHTLHVRGRIDRVEVYEDRTVVRDLKTGKQRTEAEPTHTIDAQIALYGLAAQTLAAEWGVPPRVGASYTYVGPHGVSERSFVVDFESRLQTAALRWLGVAGELLERRAFPRTPSADDCKYCPFKVPCGEGVSLRAAKLLDATPELHDFRALKQVPKKP